MAGLGDYSIQGSYKDVLNLLDTSSPNTGLTSSLKFIVDGEGTKTPVSISDTEVTINGNVTSTKMFSSDGVIGKETGLTSASILLSSSHVDLKIGNDSVLSARSTGEVRLKNLSSAPSTGSVVGDLINQGGTLMVCIGV